MNFTSSREQALARAIGADGSLNRTSGDFLYVVDSNLSYNKINRYVHLRTGYRVRIRPDGWLDANLTLHFHNTPAPAYMATSAYGIGPGGSAYGGPLDYADFVRIYVPNGAQLIDQSGWSQRWTGGPAYGKEMFAGYLIVPKGKSRTIHLHYVVPPNVFSATSGHRYSLFVQHQPGGYPDQLSVSVTRADARTYSWTVDNPTLDWSTSVPVRSTRFTPIPLPRSSVPRVTPNTLIEPHAYLSAPSKPRTGKAH
jgi:hypothetical protein